MKTSSIQHCVHLLKQWTNFLLNSFFLNRFIVLTREEDDIFLRMVFCLFDGDMSGELEYTEFLMAMYHFMTLEKKDLELFTFQIFDLDGGGTLSSEEITFMISVV